MKKDFKALLEQKIEDYGNHRIVTVIENYTKSYSPKRCVGVPTKTQRNFKKQMREFQKKNKNIEMEKVYSYIEDDFISSYYDVKKRKRRIISGVSIMVILLFLWNAYAAMSWLNSIVYSFTGKNLLLPITQTFNTGLSRKKEILNYIQTITFKESKIRQLLDDAIKILNGYLPDNKTREQYIQILNNSIQEGNALSKELRSITPPEEINILYDNVIKEFNTVYQILCKALQIVNSTNTQEINKYIHEVNSLIAEYNRICNTKSEILIEIFKKTGIKHEMQRDGTIRYWIP